MAENWPAPDELRDLLSEGESETLEFKVSCPPASQLARLISSMANTLGGKLVLGVQEGGEILGVRSPASAERQLQEASHRMTPSLKLGVQRIAVGTRTVLLVTIPKAGVLTLADGVAYERVNDRSTAISAAGVRRVLYSNRLPEEVIQELSARVAALNKTILKQGRWSARFFDWVAGGIVGAAISLLMVDLPRLITFVRSLGDR